MNSLVKVFSNFKDFYNEINGATLTGAIDVVVVEQPDGEYLCSPFHVRFGKLGVLRSREKIVDIEINGEPANIHMKLGDSGEAFFVEECDEEDVEALPDNLATSPIPTSFLQDKFSGDDTLESETTESKPKTASDDLQLPLPLPRRNSFDLSKDAVKDEPEPKFENQVSDFSHRRHTDNTFQRPQLMNKLHEYTTQKLREEWAVHEEIFHFEPVDKEKEKEWSNSTHSEERPQDTPPSAEVTLTAEPVEEPVPAVILAPESVAEPNNINNNNSLKDESKGKKKRRKKSQLKKKNAQRKSSSSSSLGSTTLESPNAGSASAAPANNEEVDTISISISNNTNSSSNDELALAPNDSAAIEAAKEDEFATISENCQTSPMTPSSRIHDLDIHFFSDTEVTSSGGNGPCVSARGGAGRPSTPIQSDSELEISIAREKDADMDIMKNSASWKWGELPTPEQIEQKEIVGGQSAQDQAQRNSMLSGMFNFMRKANKVRKQVTEGGVYLSDLDAEGMNPEMAALYFPNVPLRKEKSLDINAPDTAVVGITGGTTSGTVSADDDRESGNGTSLPHSPSSMEEGQKSLDSDYEDSKVMDNKYLDFVAMSLCGFPEKRDPTDEDFDRHIIKYSDLRKKRAPLFGFRGLEYLYRFVSSKEEPETKLDSILKHPKEIETEEKPIDVDNPEAVKTLMSKVDTTSSTPGSADEKKRSWWNWRRSQNAVPQNDDTKGDGKDIDLTAVATTQTTRPNSPDISLTSLSKTDSTLNAENTSAFVENMDDLSTTNNSSKTLPIVQKGEHFKKSLRLSSEAIKNLNLKEGMNEIEFSVTTAYQGTTRCKCYLFRWRHDDKVVISDIDGTITKSDVLGHILPMVGKDWAQLGVAQLFSKIEQNGYKLLYLSARAIGQSRATREYLRSIRQGDVMLPNGPLLLNPTSLISAFHREVIERKPEQFKIACLSDIRDLFPARNPFYAGYGNRINDVWAYRAVGIPIMRIFTINTKGELKHELTQTFQSSYSSMSYIVDQFFPPIKAIEECVEYSNFNFWRDPIPELNIVQTVAANPRTLRGRTSSVRN